MGTILVTGGAGYVGSTLVPKLLKQGHQVKVLDLMIYGVEVFDSIKNHPSLQIIKGDIRDQELLKKSLKEVNTVIHLACISNDPSFDLNSNLGKSINFDAFRPLVEISKLSGVKRFIYASSSSVYGVKTEPNVTEDFTLEPLTDYSKYKALCEDILDEYQDQDFTTVTIRPATVCGYSKRQRLDVIVNILTNHAYHNRVIKVFGGEQLRPNIHIDDMTDLYVKLVDIEKNKIAGKRFNAGEKNYKVSEIARMVKSIVGDDVKIEQTQTDDNRSYHVSSQKIANELGFIPQKTISDAINDLKAAFESEDLTNSMQNPNYYNIKKMLEVNLQ